MDRREFLTAIPATIPLLAGCGGDGDQGGQVTATATPASNADTTVEMKDIEFNPIEAEVEVGGTVEWVNEDQFEHDVTSAQFSDGAASWDFQKTLLGGESATYTFDSEGFYEYSCTIHGRSAMCGVVVVGSVSYDGSLPCQSDDGGGGY